MLMPSKEVEGRLKLSAAAVTLFLVVAICRPDDIEACGPGRGGGRRRSPRKLTPLVFKQHVPNVSENTLGASGLVEGKLTRDHPKFKELVPNYNADIIFKDEEGTGSDRLMTQRCKEKLNTLAISVMNQWPGVRLRVTEGWDEEGLHAPNSLHYEGRAVDITTSDRDRSKYGMLARLAVESGFDWVYYESRSHIHCSVKSESADPSRTGGCFHGKSVVRTTSGLRTMSELRVGDYVLTVDSSGSLRYSEVVMFLDRDEIQSRLYYTIETAGGRKITLTPSHLIYVSKTNESDVNDGFITFARNIEPGLYVYTSANSNVNTDPDHHKVTSDRVTRVSATTEIGVFAPLTSEGNIVVNDVVASCYAVINHQTLAHWAFLPVRFMENIKVSFLHLLQKLHFIRYRNPKATNYPKGIHWYAKMLYTAARYLFPPSYLYES